jgi:DNA-binding MarR family transcriptional regulator
VPRCRCLIHLTASGRDTQLRAAAALEDAAATLLAPLDAAERRQLVVLLAKIASGGQELSAAQ